MFDSFWLFVHHHGSMLPIMLLGYILLARIWGIWVEGWMRSRIVGAATALPKAAPQVSSRESVRLRLNIRAPQAPAQTIGSLRA